MGDPPGYSNTTEKRTQQYIPGVESVLNHSSLGSKETETVEGHSLQILGLLHGEMLEETPLLIHS